MRWARIVYGNGRDPERGCETNERDKIETGKIHAASKLPPFPPPPPTGGIQTATPNGRRGGKAIRNPKKAVTAEGTATESHRMEKGSTLTHGDLPQSKRKCQPERLATRTRTGPGPNPNTTRNITGTSQGDFDADAFHPRNTLFVLVIHVLTAPHLPRTRPTPTPENLPGIPIPNPETGPPEAPPTAPAGRRLRSDIQKKSKGNQLQPQHSIPLPVTPWP